MVPWLAVLCFDTGHILMSVSDHKHLAWKLPQCVIFRGWDGKFEIQMLMNSRASIAIKVFQTTVF